MLDQVFNSPNWNYLQRALTAATTRQEVISHNIANVNTPNFRSSSVEFEDLLAKELYGNEEPAGKLKLVRTKDKHLPADHIPIHAEPTIVSNDDTIMREDENNVDIDIEMASLTKNQLYFNALSRQLGGYITNLRNVITSGQ